MKLRTIKNQLLGALNTKLLFSRKDSFSEKKAEMKEKITRGNCRTESSREFFVKTRSSMTNAQTNSSSNFLLASSHYFPPKKGSNMFTSLKLKVPKTTKSHSILSLASPSPSSQRISTEPKFGLKGSLESLKKPDLFNRLFQKRRSSLKKTREETEATQTNGHLGLFDEKEANFSKKSLTKKEKMERACMNSEVNKSIRLHLVGLSQAKSQIPKNALTNLCMDDNNLHVSNPISAKSASNLLEVLESTQANPSPSNISPNKSTSKPFFKKDSIRNTNFPQKSPGMSTGPINNSKTQMSTAYLTNKNHNPTISFNPQSKTRLSTFRSTSIIVDPRDQAYGHLFQNRSSSFGVVDSQNDVAAFLLQKYYCLAGLIKKQLGLLYLNENTNENNKIIDEIAKGSSFLMELKKKVARDKYQQFQMDFTKINQNTLSDLEFFSRNMHTHLFLRREKIARQLKEDLIHLSRKTMKRKNEIADCFHKNTQEFLEFSREMNQIENQIFGFRRAEMIPKKIKRFEEAFGKLFCLSSNERKLEELYTEIYETIDFCRAQLNSEKLF